MKTEVKETIVGLIIATVIAATIVSIISLAIELEWLCG